MRLTILAEMLLCLAVNLNFGIMMAAASFTRCKTSGVLGLASTIVSK